jgi:hypothetical protein
VVVNFSKPESVTDKRWEELGVSQEQINELAVDSLVIKAQAGARNQLEKGAKAVQEYVDNYKFGMRTGGGTRAVKLAPDVVKSAKFSPEQIAALKAAGVTFDEPEAAPAAGAKEKTA